MKRLPRLIGMLTALGLAGGCATYIGISMLKPARLNIGSVKKLAVLDFEFKGSWKFWHEDEELTFEGIAKKVLVKQLGLEKGQTAPPDPVRAYPGREITAKLIAKLVQNGHYQVVERAELEKILSEHKLAMTGLVDETQAAQIGKLLGVDALILGLGSYTVSDEGKWKEYKEKVKRKIAQRRDDTTRTTTEVEEEITIKKYEAVRRAQAQLTYRVVDVTTGVIKASMTNSGGGYAKVEQPKMPDAYAGLPDWRPLVDQAVNSIVNQCLQQLAPYYVSQRREIKKGKTADMKAGMDYAKRGMMEEAKKAWEMALRDNSNKGLKCRPYAMYNLGVYYELTGDLDQAEELFESCYRLTRKEEYLDHKARIQYRRKEVERLERQQQE